jgi:hypothetical protein
MTYAGTPESRVTTNDSPDGLEIVVPAPRVWIVIVFLGLWLGRWATGEVFALRAVLGVGPVKAYALDRISNLRAQEMPAAVSLKAVPAGTRPTQEQAAALLALVGIRGPGIAFDYEGKPVRFGFALDALEARQIVAQLQARHAFAGGQAA